MPFGWENHVFMYALDVQLWLAYEKNESENNNETVNKDCTFSIAVVAKPSI